MERFERTKKEIQIDVSDSYGLNLVTKFSETDSIGNKKRNNQRLLNEEAQIEVLGTFVAELTSSLPKVAEQTEISRETVTFLIEEYSFVKPYKSYFFLNGNVNVRAGILGNVLIRPLFIEENLTGEPYLTVLEETIDPPINVDLETQN